MKKNGRDVNKNSLVEHVLCPSFLRVSTLTEERATKRLDGAKHATGCPKTGMSKTCVELVVSLGPRILVAFSGLAQITTKSWSIQLFCEFL